MGKSVPTINQWYQNIVENRLFEVIAVNEYSSLIDVRYADSTYENSSLNGASDENSDLDEISFHEWSQMVVVAARPPECWRSAIGIDKESQMLGGNQDNIVMPNPDNSSIDKIEAADYLFGWDEF
jgi:hypothetical protein